MPRGKESTIDLTTQASTLIAPARSDTRDDTWPPAPDRPASQRASAAVLRLVDGNAGGLFLLSAVHEGTRSGALVRWVHPCAADPPMITVSFRRGIATAPLVYDSRCFALSLVSESDRLLRHTFASPHGRGEDPFLGLRTFSTPGGCPVPSSALGWLECQLAFNIDLEADCGLYIGLVSAGRIAGDP